MATFLPRNRLFFSQIKQFYKSASGSSVKSELVFNPINEKKAFHDVLPGMLKSLVTDSKLGKLPQVGSWVKQFLDYTLNGDKHDTGLSVPFAYRMLEEPQNFTEKTLHSARVLGWCLKMLQAYFLMVDDIVGGSRIQGNEASWYKQPKDRFIAGNHATLIYQTVMEALDTNFGKTHFYTDLAKLFNEIHLYKSMGEYLDCSTTYSRDKNNIDELTMDLVNTIATYKTAYFSVRLPMCLALLLVKNGNAKATAELSNISLEIGRLLHIQANYLDVYGGDTVGRRKGGTDIQEGKCTWLAVTALQYSNDAHRTVFEECYGSKDAEHVKRIKRLYDILNIPLLYEGYERNAYNNLKSRIYALSCEAQTKYFLQLLNYSYKTTY